LFGSSIGLPDRGIREPEGLRRVSGAGLRLVLLGRDGISVVCSSIGLPDRGFESLKDCAASAALGFGRFFWVATAFPLFAHPSVFLTEDSRA